MVANEKQEKNTQNTHGAWFKMIVHLNDCVFT